jgi:hypothetical protein
MTNRQEQDAAGPHEQTVELSGSMAPEAVRVRRMRIPDLRLLAARMDAIYLDQPLVETDRAGILLNGARTLRPFDRTRPLTHLAFTGANEFAGVIQFRQTALDPRWTAVAIGLMDGVADPDRIVEGLLEFSIKRAGSRGVKRLFARLPRGIEMSERFRRAGFEPYMSETVLQITPHQGIFALSMRVRPQEAGETWAVHQLYHASAPKTIQFAEAWTSHRWDVAGNKGASPGCMGFVIEEDNQLIAYARLVVGNNAAVIEAMFLPGAASAGIEVVQDVIRRAGSQHGAKRIFVTVRGHQSELLGGLSGPGCVVLGEQDLTVRYTAAKVAAKSVEVLKPVSIEVRERAPKRVPTFMKRPHEEELAP